MPIEKAAAATAIFPATSPSAVEEGEVAVESRGQQQQQFQKGAARHPVSRSPDLTFTTTEQPSNAANIAKDNFWAVKVEAPESQHPATIGSLRAIPAKQRASGYGRPSTWKFRKKKRGTGDGWASEKQKKHEEPPSKPAGNEGSTTIRVPQPQGDSRLAAASVTWSTGDDASKKKNRWLESPKSKTRGTPRPLAATFEAPTVTRWESDSPREEKEAEGEPVALSESRIATSSGMVNAEKKSKLRKEERRQSRRQEFCTAVLGAQGTTSPLSTMANRKRGKRTGGSELHPSRLTSPSTENEAKRKKGGGDFSASCWLSTDEEEEPIAMITGTSLLLSRRLGGSPPEEESLPEGETEQTATKEEGGVFLSLANPRSRELDPRNMAAGLSMGRSNLQGRLSLGHGREKGLRRPGQQLVLADQQSGPSRVDISHELDLVKKMTSASCIAGAQPHCNKSLISGIRCYGVSLRRKEELTYSFVGLQSGERTKPMPQKASLRVQGKRVKDNDFL
ncbi:unnamed protein product [Linum tenue]|uniref:Uncharacterized protein n=1 Tax=Linum tenue TaxID=586396 RepID=A0AAV0QGV6_9ROSI|nr:unnamed protein product [Linum tenue]